jgi:hypothetical protein
MSETYPRKNLCETLFAGHISLQRRIRLQRYEKNRICARAMRFFWCSGRPLADYGLGFRGVIEPLVGGRAWCG